MNRDIATLREVCSKVTQMLAGMGIKVTQRGMSAYVETDERTLKPRRVNIPYIPDNATEDLILGIQGFIDHEVAHILFTDWKIVRKANKHSKSVAMLHNIIEDTYIEREILKKFPGSAFNLKKVQEFFLKHMTEPALKKHEGDPNNEFAILAVPAIRAWSGQTVFQDYMKTNDYWSRIAPFVEKIGDLADGVKSVRNSKQAYDLAVKIDEALRTPPEEDEGEGSGDGKSESGDGSSSKKTKKDKERGSESSESESSFDDDAGSSSKKETKDEEAESESSEDEDETSSEKDDTADDTDTDTDTDGEPGTSDDHSDEDETGDAEDFEEDDGDAGDEDASDGEGGERDSSDRSDDDDEPGDAEGHIDDDWFDAADKEAIKASDFDDGASSALTVSAEGCAEEAEYLVFTDEFDKIERFRFEQSDYRDEWLTRLDDETRHMIGPMQKNIERMMAARSQVVNIPGYRSGRLHGASLHRLATGDTRVFRRRQENRSMDTVVSLVVDCSGSMGGAKIKVAMSAAYALSQTLERVKIRHECIGFTTVGFGMDGVPGHDQRMMRAEAKRMGRDYSRFEAIHMPIFKDWDERLTSETKRRFAAATRLLRLSQNLDGESIRKAGYRLLCQQATRRVMIVLSDGEPAAAGDHRAQVDYLRKTVKDLDTSGVELVGIGIMDSSVRHYYPRHVVLNDLDALPGQVMAEIKRILA